MNAPSSPATSAGHIARLGQAWHAISPRERRLVLIAAGVVLVGLVVAGFVAYGLFLFFRARYARL